MPAPVHAHETASVTAIWGAVTGTIALLINIVRYLDDRKKAGAEARRQDALDAEREGKEKRVLSIAPSISVGSNGSFPKARFELTNTGHPSITLSAYKLYNTRSGSDSLVEISLPKRVALNKLERGDSQKLEISIPVLFHSMGKYNGITNLVLKLYSSLGDEFVAHIEQVDFGALMARKEKADAEFLAKVSSIGRGTQSPGSRHDWMT